MKRFVIPTRLNVTKSKKICVCVDFDSVSPFCPCVARLHGVSKLIIFADKFGSTMNVYEIIDRFYPNDDALKNIAEILNMRVSRALKFFENVPKMYSAGADIFVVGTSSVFKKGMTIKEGTDKLYKLLDEI